MRNTSNHNQRDDRGVSELVGVVLLFGIVIAGSAMIFVSGTAVTDDVRAEGRVDAASSALVELDSTVQSLAQRRGNNQEAVSMGAVDPNKAEIRDTGQLEIQINGESACTATMDLSALEYNDDGGTTIAYESGAIWKRTDAGLVTQKAPEIGFQDGALQLQVVRIDGSVEDDEMSIDYDRAESISETEVVRNDLFANSDCRRPQELSLTIESDYYQGWADHLESQFGASNVNVDGDAQTVTAQAELDAEYDVIDIPGSGPGTIVSTPSGDDVFDLGPSPLYSGATPTTDDDPDYAGTVTFLGAEHATYDTDTVTEEEEVPVDYTAEYTEPVNVPLSGTATVEVTNREWEWDNRTEDVPPLEVSFVIDESGSMGWYSPGSTETKLEKARDATRTFLDVMADDEGHRASLIGYDMGYGSPTVYEPFTEDQDAVENELWSLQAGGSTDIPTAIEASVNQFESSATQDHNQVMVLLTDGQDRSGRDPVTVAQNQIPDYVTVYTIGVGEDVNDDVLRDVAAAGDEDSKYINVEDPEELESTFEKIAKDETTIPHKEWSETTVVKEVPVTDTGEDEVTVEREIPASADVDVGDVVTVSGSGTATDSKTVEKTVSVEREITGPNGTTTKTVTRTVQVAVSGSKTTSISGEHTVTEDRTELRPAERDVPVVTWSSVSMAVSSGGDTVDLWSGANLNARSDAVESGAYANIWADDGDRLEFEPSVRSCTDHTRTGETVVDDGTEYTVTECNAYGGAAGSSTVHLFANGDTIAVPESSNWETPLREMLTVDGKQYFGTSGGTMTAANLDSNQMLVVVEAEDTSGSGAAADPDSKDSNNVVLLVELGESDDTSGKHLVNVEVTAVSAQSGDADDDDD